MYPVRRLTVQRSRGKHCALVRLLVCRVGQMILRCTAKLQAIIGRAGPDAAALPAAADDWYANLLWIDGRKCLLATHAGTLFSVFVPDVRAPQLRPIGAFLLPRIVEQCAAEGLSAEIVGVTDSCAVRIAKTADRSVLGCMNDLALHCEYAVADAGGLAQVDLVALHHRLQRNITSAREYVPAIELLTTQRDV